MTDTASIDLSFVSIGCNRIASCAEWAHNSGLLAYAANRFVALYEPLQKNRVVATLKGHTKRVNSISFIKPALVSPQYQQTPETELISASVDGTMIHWKLLSYDYNGSITRGDQWQLAQVLNPSKDADAASGAAAASAAAKKKKPALLKFKIDPVDELPNSDQTNSITYVTTLVGSKDQCYVAGCSADGKISIYYRESSQYPFKLFQYLTFSVRATQECCAMFFVSEEEPVLCSGGIDSRVHIYRLSSADAGQYRKFELVCSLKGHYDWIRAMKVSSPLEDGSYFLATASQDSKIRLWHFSSLHYQYDQAQMTSSYYLSQRAFLVPIGGKYYQVVLDAMLIGHEEWVHSIDWHPPKWNEKLQYYVYPQYLLSSSMDRTMVIWAPSEDAGGIWEPIAKMGEFGGLSGLFGQLGYFTGNFSGDGKNIVSTGYHGSFHLWRRYQEEGDASWSPQISISGHYGPVMDCSWDPKSNYFLTCSSDYTTRLFAPWSSGDKQLHEIGRPYIHGYDMECLTFVTLPGKDSHIFVSGADEKVLRVFEAPDMFLASLKNISGVELPSKPYEQYGQQGRARALGASVPALGLSNKAVLNEADLLAKQNAAESDDMDFIDEVSPILFYGMQLGLEQPPFEYHLLYNTLWPEIYKLYGHDNELVTVACNHAGTVLASACKAKQQSEAGIILWDTLDQNWRPLSRLEQDCHTLTVTYITFSPDDSFMLSVSRDRNMILYEKQLLECGKSTYEPVLRYKGHERIIWASSWTSDSKLFATGSRDNVVKVWSVEGFRENYKLSLVCTLPEFTSGVTAVEFVRGIDGKYQNLLAIGLENGAISLWNAETTADGLAWKLVVALDDKITHCETVRRLRWRKTDAPNKWQLLSCSEDWSIRVFDVTLP